MLLRVCRYSRVLQQRQYGTHKSSITRFTFENDSFSQQTRELFPCPLILKTLSLLTFYGLRGYRLFARISTVNNGFMHAKRANRNAMHKPNFLFLSC